MTDISVIIITHNEENKIKHCLQSIQWAREIIVVDAGSHDRTVNIAKELGAKVFHQDWAGYVRQRQFAIEQTACDWVLSIDSDEIVTKQLKESIRKRVGREKYTGYFVNRLNHFMEKPIKHCGWHPDFVLRIFMKEKAALPNVLIHEGFDVYGDKSTLEGDLLHYSYSGFSDYIEKMNRYTSLETKDKLKRLGDKSIHGYDLIFHPLSRFWRMYLVNKGFLDGVMGLYISILSTIYLFVLYAKMWDYQRKNEKRTN